MKVKGLVFGQSLLTISTIGCKISPLIMYYLSALLLFTHKFTELLSV